MVTGLLFAAVAIIVALLYFVFGLLFASVAIIVALLYFVFLLLVWLDEGWNRHIAQAGPCSFPLGSLSKWDDLLALNEAILRIDDSTRNRLPDDKRNGTVQGVVGQWTFWKHSVALVRPEFVEAAFRASSSRALSPSILNSVGMRHMKKFFGENSVGVSEGAVWRRDRKHIGMSLKPSTVRGMFTSLVQAAQDGADLMLAAQAKAAAAAGGGGGGGGKEAAGIQGVGGVKGPGVDCARVFHAVTLDVIGEAIFKERLGALAAAKDGKPNPIVEAFRFAEDEMVRRTSSMDVRDWLYWQWLGNVGLSSSQKRLDEASVTIRGFVEGIIKRQREKRAASTAANANADAAAANDDDGDDAGGGDLLRLMDGDGSSSSSSSGGSGLVDNVLTMIWAGHDTTAAALSFALHMLVTHIGIQDKLRAELTRISYEEEEEEPAAADSPKAASSGGSTGSTGSGLRRLASADAVRTAPFLNAVVMETLRLHPPTLWTNRGLEQDLDLPGCEVPGPAEDSDDEWFEPVTLPAGSGVFFPIHAIHRSKRTWGDDADEFVPERFMPPCKARHRFAFIPFGGGRRVCPGQDLAPFEVKVILAHLVLNYEFTRVAGMSPRIQAAGMVQQCLDNHVRLSPVGR